MKKTAWMGALVLSALAALPFSAGAEGSLSPAAILKSTVSEARDTVAEAGMTAGYGFLPVLDLGGGVTYHPVERTSFDVASVDVPMPVGQLRIERDGLVQTADVIDFESFPAEMGSMFDGLFPEAGGDITPEGLRKIVNFNRNLGHAQVLFNQMLVDLIAQERAETGEPLPYSLLYTELHNVEIFHLMSDMGDALVYTTGGRLLLYVDGWILPQYVKAYLWKEGPAYRVVALWTSDSQKEAAQEAGRRLVRAALAIQ